MLRGTILGQNYKNCCKLKTYLTSEYLSLYFSIYIWGMSFKKINLLLVLFVVMLTPITMNAANRCWIGGSGNFECNSSWCGNSPGQNDTARFNCSGCSDGTVSLGVASARVRSIRFEPSETHTYTFDAGGNAYEIRPANNCCVGSQSTYFNGGTAIFTNGASLDFDANNASVSVGSNGSGTLIIDGTTTGAVSYFESNECLFVGNGGTGWFEVRDGARACIATDLKVSTTSGGVGTVIVDACSTMTADGILVSTDNCTVGFVCITGTFTSTASKTWDIGSGNNSNGTLSITGACSTICASNINVGNNNSGFGTLSLANTTINTSGEIRIGKLGTGYASFCNVCVSTCIDFEVGSNSSGNAGTGTLFSSNSTYCIGQDMLIGHHNDGIGTATFSNDCITVGGGFSMSLSETNNTCQSSCVTFENGTTIVVNGAAGQRSEVGTTSNDPATLHVDSCATFTYCDQRNCGYLRTGTQTIIEVDGGTINTNTPNCVSIRLEGCGVGSCTGAILRGNSGLIDIAIEFNGGFFGNGDAEDECLHFGSNSNITVLGSNSLDIRGGTMAMDAANILQSAPNMNLQGGSFHTGQAGFTQTAGTLTLNANSTIGLGTTNVHQMNFADSSGIGWNAGSVLTIKGWQGTAGSSGTAGQLIFGSGTGTLSASQLSQIQFEGYALGAVTQLASGEVVPTGSIVGSIGGHACFAAPVPEPSTYFGVILIALSATFYRIKKNLTNH